MILITGANGNLGSQTINFLLDKDPSADIAGLVRSEEKGADIKARGVELRIGDYTDYGSLQEAMKGVKVLLLISSSTVQGRIEQHKNVIKAAKEAGVGQIFYTSIVQADKLLGPLSPSHEKTEKMLKDSGLPYTVYRNTFYGDFFPMYLGNALETGTWNFPSDGKRINLALREEMGEALANGLAEPAGHKNKIYEITSANAYTLQEIAGMLSEETGREITYNDLSVEDFEEQLKKAGLPNDAVMMSTAVATTFVNGGLDYTDDALEQLLGRKPTDLRTIIKQTIGG